jgi:hypothetical protein
MAKWKEDEDTYVAELEGQILKLHERIKGFESILQQQIDHVYRLQNTIRSMTAHIRVDDDE